MSLKLIPERIYQRTQRVAPYFAAEFARIQVPSGTEWVTAWDIATLAVTWEYHLKNGSRIDPRLIDGRLDRDTGSIIPLNSQETLDLLAVFDCVRRDEEVRKDLRHLVHGSH